MYEVITVFLVDILLVTVPIRSNFRKLTATLKKEEKTHILPFFQRKMIKVTILFGSKIERNGTVLIKNMKADLGSDRQ